jgi:hypothetical protein
MGNSWISDRRRGLQGAPPDYVAAARLLAGASAAVTGNAQLRRGKKPERLASFKPHVLWTSAGRSPEFTASRPVLRAVTDALKVNRAVRKQHCLRAGAVASI